MNKHTFTKITVLILLCFASQLNGQTSDKTAYAFLQRDFTGTTSMEIYFQPGLAGDEAVSASIYRIEKDVSRQVARLEDVKPCPKDIQPGLICINRRSSVPVKIIYNFPSAVKEADKFRVWLRFGTRIKETIIENGAPRERERIIEKSDVPIDVRGDFVKVTTKFDIFTSTNKFRLVSDYEAKNYKPNGQITVRVEFTRPDEIPEADFPTYLSDRVEEIYAWLESNSGSPENIAEINLETLSGEDVTFTKEKPVGIRFTPAGLDEAVRNKYFEIFLLVGRKFPVDKFQFAVDFKNNPPIELDSTIKFKPVELRQVEALSSKGVGDDDKLGLRDFKSKLDLGVAFATSVEDDKNEQGEPIRKRNSFGYVDLRFAPKTNRPKGKSVNYWTTPFFIDAKVSNKKIDKDSLSLNRVIIGTELSIRHVMDSQNKFIYAFRGLNTSDRDFKQIEGKFNFEFRPQFFKLNNSLKVKPRQEPSTITPGEAVRNLNSDDWFGFKIEPFVGFELGRVYRQKRKPFENEENSRNIRRLFFGLDMKFDITKYFKLKLFDTFYVRGESSDARYRNYFNGEIEGLVKRSANTSQHLFLSFEKGDEPPFVTRSVNAFKVGYRINTNFFGRLP
jgi:hypothetical protein